jgi:hypothetical protein
MLVGLGAGFSTQRRGLTYREVTVTRRTVTIAVVGSLLAFVVASVGAGIPALAQASAGGAGSLDGQYDFVGGDTEVKEIDNACEAAIADMNIIVRAVARRRLRKQVVPWSTLAVRRVSTEMEFGVNGAAAVRTHLNGDPVQAISPTGDPMKMRQWFEGKKLVQVFELEVGNRRNELTLEPDGKTLKMNVQITSSQLPKPVLFALTYRRRG